jgi:hypothetical protein
MSAILLALGTRTVTPGPPDATTSAVCFLIALAGTAAVGWWGRCLERARVHRQLDELAAATPLGGIH